MVLVVLVGLVCLWCVAWGIAHCGLVCGCWCVGVHVCVCVAWGRGWCPMVVGCVCGVGGDWWCWWCWLLVVFVVLAALVVLVVLVVLVLVVCFLKGPHPVWFGVLVCWWCVS